MHVLLSFFIFFPLSLNVFAETVQFQREPIDQTTEQVVIEIALDKNEAIFKETIHFTVDNPHIQIVSWKSDKAPVSFYDSVVQKTKLGYQGKVAFIVIIKYEKEIKDHHQPADLFIQYLTTSSKVLHEHRFALHDISPFQPASAMALDEGDGVAREDQSLDISVADTVDPLLKDVENHVGGITSLLSRIKHTVSNWVETTESRLVQFLLAFVLGVFMSLTPCIYPMIPITVGILGTSSHNTLHRNFLLASSYALGMATTFALLGLFAAFCGAHCGQILANPWFVMVLVLLLAYLGFASIGLYELWIPKFMQPKNQHINRGSFLSAFLFGMGSGTIASPCMSPGLALVLSIVSNMGNVFLGFLILFIFGIGASLPLLIIGTFSASLHFLPKAGVWMVEFKKVFGFMLLGVCFYYLQNILPVAVGLGLTGLFFLSVGGYYLTRTTHYRSQAGKAIAFILSVMLFTASFYFFYKAYIAYTSSSENIGEHTATGHHAAWRSDYDAARQYAQEHDQKLLIDFGASWCSLCVALEKQVLHEPELTALFDKIVAVRVDGSKSGAEPYTSLVQEYNIMGIPTILLIDPVSGEVIKKWGSSLLDRPIQDFVQELEQYL